MTPKDLILMLFLNHEYISYVDYKEGWVLHPTNTLWQKFNTESTATSHDLVFQ